MRKTAKRTPPLPLTFPCKKIYRYANFPLFEGFFRGTITQFSVSLGCVTFFLLITISFPRWLTLCPLCRRVVCHRILLISSSHSARIFPPASAAACHTPVPLSLVIYTWFLLRFLFCAWKTRWCGSYLFRQRTNVMIWYVNAFSVIFNILLLQPQFYCLRTFFRGIHCCFVNHFQYFTTSASIFLFMDPFSWNSLLLRYELYCL